LAHPVVTAETRAITVVTAGLRAVLAIVWAAARGATDGAHCRCDPTLGAFVLERCILATAHHGSRVSKPLSFVERPPKMTSWHLPSTNATTRDALSRSRREHSTAREMHAEDAARDGVLGREARVEGDRRGAP